MSVSEHANYLLNEYGRLQFDYAAYCKPYGESLRNEARNNLEEYIAELEDAQRWTPVSEKLPEANTPVLTISKGNDVATPIDVALRKRIAGLEAAQRWIPVSERLPEFNKVVAVIDMSDKDSHLCNVYETAILVEVRGDTRFVFIGHSGWDSSDVTHWMPLPELPEVQE
jgi:hypothetical protein